MELRRERRNYAALRDATIRPGLGGFVSHMAVGRNVVSWGVQKFPTMEEFVIPMAASRRVNDALLRDVTNLAKEEGCVKHTVQS
jgi:hypothetical protein